MMLVPVFLGDGVLEIQERAMPQIKNPDDVLLRVEACGLCGTDLTILTVPPRHKADVGVVLGHEFVGAVAEIGIAPRVLLCHIVQSEELWKRCLYTNRY